MTLYELKPEKDLVGWGAVTPGCSLESLCLYTTIFASIQKTGLMVRLDLGLAFLLDTTSAMELHGVYLL